MRLDRDVRAGKLHLPESWWRRMNIECRRLDNLGAAERRVYTPVSTTEYPVIVSDSASVM
jgi:hypothetical protein